MTNPSITSGWVSVARNVSPALIARRRKCFADANRQQGARRKSHGMGNADFGARGGERDILHWDWCGEPAQAGVPLAAEPAVLPQPLAERRASGELAAEPAEAHISRSATSF